MVTVNDLRPEILMIILRMLPPEALLGACYVLCLHAAALPFLYSSFKGSSDPKRTIHRLRLFLASIAKDKALGGYVKSIIVDEINREDEALMGRVLSRTPNIKQLAIPGHLHWLKESIETGKLSLPHLQAFRSVNCEPEIWHVVSHFPQLSRLSLRNYSYSLAEWSWPSLPNYSYIRHVPISSLPIEHITLEDCDLFSDDICTLIKGCKRLESFRYLLPLGQFPPPLDVTGIYKALILHKTTLEELDVELYHNPQA